jgi:hypothetical protein
MPRRKEPHIPDAILDQLLAGADPKTAFDPNGLLDGLKKALAERALNAEMDHHLAREETGNSRNGYGRKTVVTDTGKLDLQIPRDRQASFDPQLMGVMVSSNRGSLCKALLSGRTCAGFRVVFAVGTGPLHDGSSRG